MMDAVRLSWRSADGQPPGVRSADGGLAARHRRWRFRRELFRSCRSTEAGHPGCCTSLLWQFAGYDGALAAGATLVVVAPLPGGSYRVVATMDNAPEHLSKSDVQAVMDSRGPEASNATVLDVLWSSRFRLHHRLANSYRCGRLILMGDAAHVHSPAGGQGMNTSLVDAVVLGETLAGVVGRNRPETMLDVYESLRRPAAARVLGLAGRLTDMATTHGIFKRAARNVLLSFVDLVPIVKRQIEMNLSGLSRANLAHLPNYEHRQAA